MANKRRRVEAIVPKEIRQSFLGFLHIEDIQSWRSTCKRFKNDLAATPNIELRNADLCIPAVVRELTVEDLSAGLDRINDFHHLESLVLARTLTDSHLEVVAKITNLRKLSVTGSRQVTDHGMSTLVSLVNLRKLVLYDFCKISPDRWYIATFGQLETLSIIQSDVSDRCFFYISQLACLKVLTISHNANCPRVTKVGFEYLAKLQLVSLTLRNLSTIDLAPVSRIATLTSLDVQKSTVRNLDLQHLRNLPNLCRLDLTSCWRITDAGVAHLATLTSLEFLSLAEVTGLTDNGLVHVGSLLHLKHLSLHSCNLVTDTGIAHVMALPNLKKLELAYFTKVTPAAIAPFKHPQSWSW
jgi:F-box and leucine-rich repeat protein 14